MSFVDILGMEMHSFVDVLGMEMHTSTSMRVSLLVLEGGGEWVWMDLFVCLFCCFTSQVNSYGHGVTVSSPNHTFSWASLKKQLTSTSCTYFRL